MAITKQIALRAYAVSIGVVIHRSSGAVVRIFNPDFEEELDGHFVGLDEFMLRIAKTHFGVSAKPDSMTVEHVHRIVSALGATL